MRRKSCLTLLAIAGTASAEPEMITLTAESLPADTPIGHIYYNAATGEMVRTAGPMTQGSGRGLQTDPIWINTDTRQCLDEPSEIEYYNILDSADPANERWVLDWGDLEPDSRLDSFSLMFVTSVFDPEGDGEDGFDLHITLFDRFDHVQIGCNVPLATLFEIDGLPGSTSTDGDVAVWMLTVDLAGGDGSFMFGNYDMDGDQLNEFGVGFNFNHPKDLTVGRSGLVLVVPPGRAEPNILGNEDNFGLCLTTNWDQTNPAYWFGGYNCDPAQGEINPWAAFYFAMYGRTGPPCQADRNSDRVLDFFDVQDFLIDFAAEDPSADFNDDGLFEFFDVQGYFHLFVSGCP